MKQFYNISKIWASLKKKKKKKTGAFFLNVKDKQIKIDTEGTPPLIQV